MKLTEAFNKAALLGSIAVVKRSDTGETVLSTSSFTLSDVSYDGYEVMVPKFSKDMLALVWDRTKPASSPSAAENQFFARIVNELNNLGAFATDGSNAQEQEGT